MFGRAIFLVACALALPGLAEDLARYTNARFGITALVPSRFAMQPPPENGDGARFDGPAGGSVVVYGGHDLFGGLGPAMGFVRDELARVTYEAAGPGWQVVSGFALSGEIVYHRAEIGHSCSGDAVIGHIEFRYPEAARGVYDALIEASADSLGFAPC